MMKGTDSINTLPHILVDTNVLLRLTAFGLPDSNSETPQGVALEVLLADRYIPCITFQNLAEYWAVAGRSVKSNGFAMSIEEICDQVKQFRVAFKVLPERPASVDIWQELCRRHKILGRRVHDVRLAATAIANGVHEVLTSNVKDFEMFEELSVIDPESISN